MSMKYEVNVNPVASDDSNVKGFANLVLGGAFKITNIAILENSEKKQLFVSMPRYRSSFRDENNAVVYKDVCNPITKEFRADLYGKILERYEQAKNHVKSKEEEEATEMPEFSVSVTVFDREEGNMKGLARIFFEDKFIVNNVSILEGKGKLFVAMPSYKTKQMVKGKPVYQDVCYPVTKEFREKLYTEILQTYEREREKHREENQIKEEMKKEPTYFNQNEEVLKR